MIISISGKIGSGKDTVGTIIQWLASNSKPYNVDTLIKVLSNKDYHTLNKINSSFEIKKWADYLKDIVCGLINCTREQLEDREFKEKELREEWWYWKLERTGGYGTTLLPYNTEEMILASYTGLKLVKPTPRLLLQLIGTECGRNIIHPNIWVNSLMSKYKMSYTQHKDIEYVEHKQYPNWIITDTRFENELKAVKDRGGISIKVNRLPYYFRADVGEESWHIWSEKRNRTGLEVNCNFNHHTEETSLAYYYSELKEYESETALDNAEFDEVIDNNEGIPELIEKVKEILIRRGILCQ